MTARGRPPIPRAARAPLVVSAGAGVLAGLAVLAQANLLAYVLAAVFAGHPIPRWPLLGVLGAVGVRAVATWVFGAQGQRAATAVGAALRTDLLAHVDRLGPGWLAARPTGRLTTLVTRGLDAIDPYVRDYLPQLAVAAVLPVAVLVQLAAADPLSALIVLATLPLVPVFAALAGMRAKAAAEGQWATLARLGGHFLDAVTGLPTLVLFGRARAHATVVRRLADEHHRATMRTLRIAFLSALVLELVAALSVALVAVPIALRLLDGTFDLRTALLVLLVVPEAYLPLRLAGQRFHAATEALAVTNELNGILTTPVPHRTRPPATSRTVRLDNVTVRHPGRPDPVLRGVDLVTEPGEWLAIAGPSGSGKSTIFAVLLGLLPPEAGTLSTTDNIAWLPQRPHLFSGTVADNIRLGCPAVTEAAIADAAERANAAEFVADLPRGHHTPIGERGTLLSTGQRQRIALARLLLRVRYADPAVVLLDEPTTGLDLSTESAVLTALRKGLAGRTVLIATHRPAVLTASDRLLLLRDGTLRPTPLVLAS